jgi:hypothetical protein
MADSAKNLGGIGGNSLTIDVSKAADRRLVLRAINAGWATPQATRDKIMEATVAVMMQGDGRDVVGCANLLVAADRYNLDAERRERRKPRPGRGRPKKSNA